MLKKVLIGVAALIAIFLVVVALQPATYHVERSTAIAAPASVVWTEVASFEQWNDWTPWNETDPTVTLTYDGEPGAVGHRVSWSGEKVGKGNNTITAIDAPRHLDFDFVYTEPMASTARCAFDLATADDGVKITWSIDGTNGFLGKMVGLFMDMEGMIGGEYEKRLARLKAVAEENARKQAATVAAAAPAAGDPPTAAPEDSDAAGDEMPGD